MDYKSKKPDIIIGIDPDTAKSGIAYLETSTKKLELSNFSFTEICGYLTWVKGESVTQNANVVVVVEASWSNTHNTHLKGVYNKGAIAKTGYNVGRNHQVGKDICDLCRHLGLEVIEQHPLRKGWKGKDKKITHEELAYFTGIMGRTNQESRDAALLAWNYAGFPIKINPKTVTKYK